MAEDRLTAWEVLFRRALELIDSAAKAAPPLEDWTFGGGTVLMRRYRHRLSKDVDIFIGDPQYLPHLSPRLSATAEALTTRYIEQAGFLKLCSIWRSSRRRNRAPSRRYGTFSTRSAKRFCCVSKSTTPRCARRTRRWRRWTFSRLTRNALRW